MTAYSILMPYTPPRPELILPYAGLVQRGAARRLWQGQGLMCDPHQAFAYASASGHRIPVGIGVTLMPFRHPFEAAIQAHHLAVTMDQPVVMGYGPGARELQRMLLGEPYRDPLRAIREYLTITRALLDGDEVDHAGEAFTCHGMLPSLPRPRIEIGLGVLRPGAARLAGEIADVAITWLTPAAYLNDVIIPALEEGAARVGRDRPRLVAIVPVALSGPGRTPSGAALAGASLHMGMTHYADMLARAGINCVSGDSKTDGTALVEGGAFLYGSSETVGRGLAQFSDIGVDELVLNVSGTIVQFGQEAALAELTTVLDSLDATDTPRHDSDSV